MTGSEPLGWPNFTGGWNVANAAVGDVDGDGLNEVTVSHARGLPLRLEHRPRRSGPEEWPKKRHDLRNTGNYEEPQGQTVNPSPTPTATSTATTATPTPTSTPTPAAACGLTPAIGCRPPAVSGKAALSLKNRGTPDTGDPLHLEVGEGHGDVEGRLRQSAERHRLRAVRVRRYEPLGSASAPAGGLCRGGKPCWKETSKGYRYSDRDLTPGGLSKIVLKEGATGVAKIMVKGKGSLLGLPALPIPSSNLPLTVQLTASNGECWEATYTTPTRWCRLGPVQGESRFDPDVRDATHVDPGSSAATSPTARLQRRCHARREGVRSSRRLRCARTASRRWRAADRASVGNARGMPACPCGIGQRYQLRARSKSRKPSRNPALSTTCSRPSRSSTMFSAHKSLWVRPVSAVAGAQRRIAASSARDSAAERARCCERLDLPRRLGDEQSCATRCRQAPAPHSRRRVQRPENVGRSAQPFAGQGKIGEWPAGDPFFDRDASRPRQDRRHRQMPEGADEIHIALGFRRPTQAARLDDASAGEGDPYGRANRPG